MSKKPIKLMSLAAALAALPGAAMLSPAVNAKASEPDAAESTMGIQTNDARPNVFIAAGKDVLGMIMQKGADGIVTADHYSHASHASHESHSSHYSGR